jgi:thiol-disulfide isomerase/thioredoxin
MRKLIAFKASWCGPCKMITPFLQELQNEGYDVEMVDVDENVQLAEENNVLHVPTLDFFEDGKKYRRVTGYKTKAELLEFFKEPN